MIQSRILFGCILMLVLAIGWIIVFHNSDWNTMIWSLQHIGN